MSKLWELVAKQAATIEVAPVLQIAADGQWEKAAIIPVDGDLATAHAEVMRLALSARYLAIEVLWPGTMFVGTVWPASATDDAASAVTRAFEAHFADAEPPAMTALTALLGETPKGDAVTAELGAVNAWLSVGHELLWRRGDTYSTDIVDNTLADRADLMTCTHPVAIEFSVSQPSNYWVAFFVSAPAEAGHRLNQQRLHDILASVV